MFFEDLVVGERLELGSFTFSTDAIKRFASLYDPQPFHLDEAAAARSHFGGLIASGWHVAAIWMKLMVETQTRLIAAQATPGQRTGRPGPSPGFRDMRWLKPVRAGDRLRYTTVITAKRGSGARPLWGIVSQSSEAFNQHGERAFSFEGTVFWERRPAAISG